MAGRAGSIVLGVPDAGTRPTSDRVRESLFGALESADLLHGARVLDLYAGSGALGLESISRGATAADLVERGQRAATVTRENARRVETALRRSGEPAAQIRVHRTSADAFLRTTQESYDVVFLDPPYDLSDDELAATLVLLEPTLAEGATVVVERAARSPEPAYPATLVPARSKRYGDTTLWWATAQ